MKIHLNALEKIQSQQGLGKPRFWRNTGKKGITEK